MPSRNYQPDDAGITVEALHALRTPEGTLLRQEVAELPSPGHPTVAQIAALRKRFPPQAVHAALTLAGLQAKGARPQGKFPELPYVWATPEALEQATHALVARHKAHQFAQLNPARIFDLCCGIGGDTLALAEVAPVTAVDLSPVRTTCLAFNVADRVPAPRYPIEIRVSDIADLANTLPADAWLHIDPARRAAGRRSPRYEDLIPPPDILMPLFARARGGVLKLSPAVDFDSLPPGHIELVSHGGTVVQALLWLGFPRSPHTRTATVLSDTLPGWSLEAPPQPIVPRPIDFQKHLRPDSPTYFYELDGAITRAELAEAFAQQLDLSPVTLDGGYLLAPAGQPLLQHPALTAFHMHAVVPFSTARVAEALSRLPPTAPGPVEVKSRGHLPGIDTDDLQKAWSKSAPFAYTVLLFRYDRDTLAVLASRPARQPHAPFNDAAIPCRV